MPGRTGIETVEVFDDHRHASERSREFATRTFEGGCGHVVDDGIELTVDRLDAGERSLAQLAADSAVVNEVCLFGCVHR